MATRVPRDVVRPALRAMFEAIGEDPNREGLQETPERWCRAVEEWFGGYATDPAGVLKVFEDGGENCDEMVLQRDIPIWSFCEHHIAPFFGTADIAYLPDPAAPRIAGLSKLTRLADVFARRLQVQERLTRQIADALHEHLKPLGCGVVLRCRHTCMESRGVNKSGTYTTTSALLGVFRDNPNVRGEFLSFVRER